MTGSVDTSRADLASRQAELVATLVSGAAVPSGFDPRLIGVAREALLRKRAGDVARHWPLLAAGLADRWLPTFTRWAATRPTQGSLRDGWDLARSLTAEGPLPVPATEEFAIREAAWRYDGRTAPRPRRLPAVRRVADGVVVQFAGRIRILRRWQRG
ncbi:hypothetical protein GCM10027280_50730 [Micromonospora polyrhachis]|uniref:SCO6045-like C-terminal domain-containing protein n=1 Tax=Micromonospora polyrhachis TaxID=1282883 RepID=A0A7W7SW83_9ACTN|nr:hypothetical protein [Micromonospora polyrhachis]MBB4961497.1 hypothetical protein [Micromonospora polyrhachis]